jgi:hypothetical protein
VLAHWTEPARRRSRSRRFTASRSRNSTARPRTPT